MKIQITSPHIGAEIYGINLLTDASVELRNTIRSLLGEHEVLFFKEQPSMSGPEYLQIANLLGTPMNHPFISTGDPVVPGISPFQPYFGIPEITGIYHNEKNKGNLNEWHSDLNWLKTPSLGSVLRCVQRPPVGGDTVWASMTSAYNGLSQELKVRLEGLRVLHDFTQIYRGAFAGKPNALEEMQALFPAQAHPLVVEHPLYKKKALFANRVSATRIVGINPEESKSLLETIFATAKIPEYQCRYRWQENDIAVWDNLLTQHYAVSDYWPHVRKMERISLAGISLGENHV